MIPFMLIAGFILVLVSILLIIFVDKISENNELMIILAFIITLASPLLYNGITQKCQ